MSHSGVTPSGRESEVPAADRRRIHQQGDRVASRSHVKTVEGRNSNVMRKLGLTGRIDIVKYAILQGWLKTTDIPVGRTRAVQSSKRVGQPRACPGRVYGFFSMVSGRRSIVECVIPVQRFSGRFHGKPVDRR
jgi:hypothetical protein